MQCRIGRVETMDEFTVNGAPPLEEQASYFDRDYAENMVINAMARIDQTCARSRYFGSEGWYEQLAIRTDHIGAVWRWIVRRLVHVICSLSRPVPSRGKNRMVGGVAHAIGRPTSARLRTFVEFRANVEKLMQVRTGSIDVFRLVR